MIFFEYRDGEGKVIFSNMTDFLKSNIFIGLEKDNVRKGRYRNLFKTTKFGSVRIVIDNDRNFLISRKLAIKLINIYEYFYELFIKMDEEKILKQAETFKLFSHNLVDVHTHLKDKVERIFSEEVRAAGDYNNQKAKVKEKILAHPDRAADDLCQISKRIDDLDAQIVGITLLSGIAKTKNRFLEDII